MDKKNKPKFNGKLVAIIIVAAVAFSASYAALLDDSKEQITIQSDTKRAAIVDQLHDDLANVDFHKLATQYFESTGYQVDIFTTQDITVDFYKNLPKQNYDIVILRTHGAEEIGNQNSVVLFTGEKYNTEQYISEQMFGFVKRAIPFLELSYTANETVYENWNVVNSTYRELRIPAVPTKHSTSEFFAVSSKFIDEKLNGKFSKTTFILGGCNTASNPSLAKALINNGASEVIGWDNTVGSADNDRYLMMLIQDVTANKLDLKEAFERASSQIQKDSMPYPSELKYFNSQNI